jgi:multicomponent Na+:H+ antiporter subunit B
VIRDDTDIIIETICRISIPLTMLFGIYVVAHGHTSPGGGFQGGVILAASMVLLVLAFGWHEAYRRFRESAIVVVATVGVLIYAGTGFLCMLLGGEFLDYGALARVLPGDEVAARSHGMAIVELGVAFAVLAILISIFLDLVTGGRHEQALEELPDVHPEDRLHD